MLNQSLIFQWLRVEKTRLLIVIIGGIAVLLLLVMRYGYEPCGETTPFAKLVTDEEWDRITLELADRKKYNCRFSDTDWKDPD